MNPVGAEGNIFSNLFDKVPAKRAGNAEDITGTVLYLVSKAGVSLLAFKILAPSFNIDNHLYLGLCGWNITVCRWGKNSSRQWTGIV